MPRKKTTDKVTKPKVTPRKSRGSNLASSCKEDAKANQNLLFLWSCFQSTQAKVDIKAVAEEWGLNPDATRMRFLRLSRYIDKLQNAEQGEKDAPKTEAQEDQEGNGDGDGDEDWVRVPDEDEEDGDESHQEEDETDDKDETQSLKDHLLADSAYALEG